MGQLQFGSFTVQLGIKISPPQPRVVGLESYDGQMAPSNKHKKLVCFYCNKRSNVVYDGLITEWTCVNCEATNHLDRNGEITDVPVANECASTPAAVNYTTRSRSSSNASESNGVFCTTCVKNQHLYTSSLQQYELDLGIVDKATPYQWAKVSHQIETFKKGLEQRYPLVCEDCQPRVLQRMKQANYIAKTDDLRQRLERTARKRQAAIAETGIFSINTFNRIGKTSVTLAFFVQLMWNIAVLSLVFLRHNPIFPVEALYHTDSPLADASNYLPYTAWLAIGHFFWCPRFRDLLYGLKTKWAAHIKGYGNYYKLQSLFICLRLVFCYFINGIDSTSESAVVFAHSSMLLLTTLLAVYMNRAVQIDTSPLWSTPEKLPFVGPATGSPVEGMESELNRIQDSFSQRPLTPPTPTHPNSMGHQFPATNNSISQRSSGYPSPPAIQPGAFRKTPYSYAYNEQPSFRGSSPPNSYKIQSPTIELPPRTTPRLSQMSEAEGAHYLQTGIIPDRLKGSYNEQPVDEMDWSPDVSQYRAFKPAPSHERAARTTDLFGRPLANPREFSQTPVTDQPSPFWFKVPPAPITPAQRLRNPPNQPRMRVASQEGNENFFNNSSHQHDIQAHSTSFSSINQTSRPDFMAQQKFFPPTAQSEQGNELIDMLGGFTLKDQGESTAGSKIPSLSSEKTLSACNKSGVLRHVFQGLLLLLSLFAWNYITNSGIEQLNNFHLIFMLECFFIASRTMLDHTVYSYGTFQDALGAMFSCMEMFVSGYSLIAMWTRQCGFEECVLNGKATIGVILIHETFLAVFRR